MDHRRVTAEEWAKAQDWNALLAQVEGCRPGGGRPPATRERIAASRPRGGRPPATRERIAVSRPGALEILDYCETPIGLLCLRRRELLSDPVTSVTEVTLDHEFLMSSYNTISERALANLAVELHGGSELRCLVGGLGLGYTAAAALESGKVAHLEVVELLPEVIGWMERGLLPLSGQLLGDSRMRCVRGDIYGDLAAPHGDPWDLILIDVDHNPGERLDEGSKIFYSVEGLRMARDRLAPGGVLAVWSSREDKGFLENLRQVFPDARCETVTWWNDLIDEEQRDVIFLGTGVHR